MTPSGPTQLTPRSDEELLEIVRKIRADPFRGEAFHAVNQLAVRAEHDGSAARFTYNKLLRILGF